MGKQATDQGLVEMTPVGACAILHPFPSIHAAEMIMEELRFPAGRVVLDPDPTPEKRAGWIEAIAHAPAAVREAVRGLNEEQLDTPYREGGWTIRQVVHHLPDSHVNAYIRFKWALSEDEPAIKVYDEKAWAELPEARGGPIEPSLALLEALHTRWQLVLRAMTPADFRRMLVHPERGRMPLDDMLQIYAWHGRHHVAHIRSLRERSGWGA